MKTARIPTAGHITINLYLDVTSLSAEPLIERVDIENARPQDLGRLMVGLTPEQALQRIPRLFLLCSQAQQAAAYSALADVLGLTLNDSQRQALVERCRLEWLKEHSWQLWQMERSLFGDSFAQQDSLNVTRILLKALQRQPALSLDSLSESSADLTGPNPLLADIDEDAIKASFEPLFGMKPREFLVLSWTELMVWSKGSDPYSKLWSAMLDMSLVRFGAFESWNAELESGPMGRVFQQHPLVEYSLNLWGASLITRTLARLIELARACVNSQIAVPLECGVAQASRGELKHAVSIDEQGMIASYEIDAPTDRYFSHDGLLEKSLTGQHLPYNDTSWVKQLVWAIDPCVEFSVKSHMSGDESNNNP